MAWIESHQSLGRHPKMLRLAARVRACGPQVIGHLHYLWWWTLDYAPDGDLSRFAAQEIAAASEWNGDPDLWLAALRETGWIDSEGHLHDWGDYAGRLADERARDRDRKRAERALRRASGPSPPSDGRPADVPRTSGGCPPLPNPTLPNPDRESGASERAKPPPDGPADPPPGFPRTAAEAAAGAGGLGAPGDFATKLWHLAASRGWRDSHNVPLRSWPSYLAASLTFEKESDGRTEARRRAGTGSRAQPEPPARTEELRAPIL